MLRRIETGSADPLHLGPALARSDQKGLDRFNRTSARQNHFPPEAVYGNGVTQHGFGDSPRAENIHRSLNCGAGAPLTRRTGLQHAKRFQGPLPGSLVLPQDVQVPVVRAHLEELIVGSIPLVDDFLDHVVAVSQPKTDWPFIRRPSGIALDRDLHGVYYLRSFPWEQPYLRRFPSASCIR